MRFVDLAIGQRFRLERSDDVWMKVLIPKKYPDSGLCGPEEDDTPKDIRAVNLMNANICSMKNDVAVIVVPANDSSTSSPQVGVSSLSRQAQLITPIITANDDGCLALVAELTRLTQQHGAALSISAMPSNNRWMIDLVASLQQIRTNMGDNLFSVEDWQKFYGVPLPVTIPEFPWSPDILNSPCPFNPGKLIKDTHFAFLGLPDINGVPLTVAHWIILHLFIYQPKFFFNTSPWHQGQPHTDIATLEPRWYLLLKEIVPNSTGKTPEKQLVLLPPEYELPSTIAEVTKDLFVFKKTGIRSNSSRYAACAERTIQTPRFLADYVSCVGSFAGSGLLVSGWDGFRLYSVGLGASRKPA